MDNKITFIKNVADCIFNCEEKCITPDELEELLATSKSREEREFYVDLYNFFLKNRSEEVIKNGQF